MSVELWAGPGEHSTHTAECAGLSPGLKPALGL